jgi:hypothetical protein
MYQQTLEALTATLGSEVGTATEIHTVVTEYP